ncbi:MAG: zinc ribbon domain-containing protein, partial [Pseudomonadota bacterium]|nr:zinc ribbon domain-containing protein [Pseudomonadota bacterium]
RFQTQVEVKRFLERQPLFPKDLNGREVRNQRVYEMLTRVLYAGYVEHDNWGVSLRDGHHEGLIDFSTYQRIQGRLTGTAKAPARKDISQDFPLRGFVLCNDCGEALTACWSTSKTGKKHPYYLCKTKGCESYRKSIRRDMLEEDFEGLLQSLEPAQGLFKLARAMFKDAWDFRLAQSRSTGKELRKKAAQVEKQIDALVERTVEATSASVMAAFERKIKKLEEDRILIAEQIASAGKPKHTFEESFELAMNFLSSPWYIWKNSSLAGQKMVLRLAFVEPIGYCRNQGVRTPKISFPFKVLGGISSANCEMARWGGFEPPTP